jgi:phosphoribosylformylglycinamidine cyclo-ligase
MIQRESGTSWKEMFQVFNCGHRMEFYVPESLAPSLIEISESFAIPAQVIGRVAGSTTKKLTISSPYGTFEY